MYKRDVVNRTGGVQTEDGRTLYGFDAEVYLKMKAKEDPDWRIKIAEWIETVLGEQLPNKEDLWPSLKDGLVLCRLMNAIKPGTIKKWSQPKNGKLHPLMERENIGLFLEGCWHIGIQSSNMFVVADLHGRRNMQSVLNNLAALSNVASSCFGCKVPPIANSPMSPPPAPKEGDGQSDPLTKKIPKWDVPLGYLTQVHTGDLKDNEGDLLEKEIRDLKAKFSEAERNIFLLENSKKNLSAQVELQQKKIGEGLREIEFLRSQGRGNSDTSGVDRTVKLEKEISDLRNQLNQEREFEKKQKSEVSGKSEKEISNLQNQLKSSPVNIAKFYEELDQLRLEKELWKREVQTEKEKLERIESLIQEKKNLEKDYEQQMSNLKSTLEKDKPLDELGLGFRLLTQEKKKIENDYQQRLSSLTTNLEEVKKSKFQIETELFVVKSSLAEMRKFNEELNQLQLEKEIWRRDGVLQVKKEEENSRKIEKLEEKIKTLEMEKKITNSSQEEQQKQFLLQLDKIRSTFDLTLNYIKSEKSLDEERLRAEITSKIRKEYEELLSDKDKAIGQLKQSTLASPDQSVNRARDRVKEISLKNSEKELQQLREVLHKIMTGDAQNKLPFHQLETIMELFKLDNGRRVFTYVLKEYAIGVADGDVFLLSNLSFEVLKSLVDLCLEQLDLSNSADYISGKHLLETSSLIGQLKENKEIDFIQSYIKPHKCWKNTFFWEEYFWAQVTTKYGEAFSGPATESQEQQFFSKEILEFVKVIWGWGNMSIDSIVLFVESLAAKCGLPLEKQSLLINSVNHHLSKVSAQLAPRTRLITHSSAPRALRDRVASRVTHSKIIQQTSPRARLIQQGSSKEIPKSGSALKKEFPRSLTDNSNIPTVPEDTSPRKGLRPTLMRATSSQTIPPQTHEGGGLGLGLSMEVSPRSWGNKPRGERNTRMVEVMTAQTAYRMAKFVSVKDDVVSFIDNILGVEAVLPKQRNED